MKDLRTDPRAFLSEVEAMHDIQLRKYLKDRYEEASDGGDVADWTYISMIADDALHQSPIGPKAAEAGAIGVEAGAIKAEGRRYENRTTR